ncbi:MAG: sulfatase-like hydrolase/transferase, partial [Planctomycetaceae bacterium]|nr:sulfatase-like hydrolase/transferase [Planctomycetaceae bacterium]
LDQKHLTDNTLIVYVTDNGWIQRTKRSEVPDGWKQGFAPKSKQSPYDGGTRTPILLSWPGKIAPSERTELVSSIDLVPTMLKAAGADIPENLPGLDLLPALTGQQPLKRKELFGESFAHDVADVDNPQASLLYRWVIQDHWKLLLTYDGETNRYAAAHLKLDGGPQLFDLQADPFEEHNAASAHPDLVRKLAGRLNDWWPVTQRHTVDAVR